MGTVGIIVVYAVILGGMWFLLMRPQKKEQKRIQAMLADMEIGDTALTTSGFYGVIIDITDDDVIVEFGNNKNCAAEFFCNSINSSHDIFVFSGCLLISDADILQQLRIDLHRSCQLTE